MTTTSQATTSRRAIGAAQGSAHRRRTAKSGALTTGGAGKHKAQSTNRNEECSYAIDPDEAPLVTLEDALAEIAPVCLPMPPTRALEQPARWYPQAPVEQRTEQPMHQLIVLVAPRVLLVAPAPAKPADPRDEELEQLRARAEKAEAEAADLRHRWARRIAADAQTMQAGAPDVVSTEEPPLPMMSAALAGRYGITPRRRSRWQRMTAILCRWMGGVA